MGPLRWQVDLEGRVKEMSLQMMMSWRRERSVRQGPQLQYRRFLSREKRALTWTPRNNRKNLKRKEKRRRKERKNWSKKGKGRKNEKSVKRRGRKKRKEEKLW